MVKALVLDTTNGERVVLTVVAQEGAVVVVVQVQVVDVVAIVLASRPEERVVAGTVEIAIVVPEACRERREAVGIRTIAASVPAGLGLQVQARL